MLFRVSPDGGAGDARLDAIELYLDDPEGTGSALVSRAFDVAGVRFGRLPAGYDQEPHGAPNRLLLVVLSGRVEIGTPTGSRVLAAGDALLADDMGTTGHTTRTVGGPAELLFVPVQDIEGLLRDVGAAGRRGVPDASRPLAGRVALVSGAGTSGPPEMGDGVGRATALTLGRAGAGVVIVDRDPQAAATTLAAVQAEGSDAIVVVADVSSDEDCARVLADALRHFGRVDVVVNNAAIVAIGGAADTELAEWGRVLAVNLTGAMLLTRHAVPALIASGGGSIVNISSIAASRGHGLAAYAAAKGGLEALTVDTAFAYGPQGVRANTVVVGSIESPMSRRGGPNPAAERMRRVATPLGVPGTAWDVARAVLFLAGEESRWITGTRIPVDGGISTTLPTTMFGALSSASAQP